MNKEMKKVWIYGLFCLLLLLWASVPATLHQLLFSGILPLQKWRFKKLPHWTRDGHELPSIMVHPLDEQMLWSYSGQHPLRGGGGAGKSRMLPLNGHPLEEVGEESWENSWSTCSSKGQTFTNQRTHISCPSVLLTTASSIPQPGSCTCGHHIINQHFSSLDIIPPSPR